MNRVLAVLGLIDFVFILAVVVCACVFVFIMFFNNYLLYGLYLYL